MAADTPVIKGSIWHSPKLYGTIVALCLFVLSSIVIISMVWSNFVLHEQTFALQLIVLIAPSIPAGIMLLREKTQDRNARGIARIALVFWTIYCIIESPPFTPLSVQSILVPLPTIAATISMWVLLHKRYLKLGSNVSEIQNDVSILVATSRWKRPRIYLTIVAFFLITSSVAYFSYFFSYYLQATSKPLDGGAYGALAYLGLILITTVSYLILGNWAAFSLLRRKPRFVLASIVMLSLVAMFSFVMYASMPSFLYECVFAPNPSDPCYGSSYWSNGVWALLFALVCGMFTLLYKGLKDYRKIVR